MRLVWAVLGFVLRKLGVLLALVFLLSVMYMLSNLGAEEAAAMKMARQRIRATQAAEHRALEKPINTLPEVLRGVEERSVGGWSVKDVAASRVQGSGGMSLDAAAATGSEGDWSDDD